MPKLLANQKPDNLPVDWEKQLEDKKQLEIKLNTIQTDLSNEQQARQQAEKEAASLKKLKGTLNSSFPNLINSENEVNEKILKSVIEDLIESKEIKKQVDEENQIIKRVTAVIEKIENETSQRLERVETRSLVEKIRSSLEKIISESQKKVDLKNLSEEYQNQQIQSPKK